jgi:hypothetical protein
MCEDLQGDGKLLGRYALVFLEYILVLLIVFLVAL